MSGSQPLLVATIDSVLLGQTAKGTPVPGMVPGVEVAIPTVLSEASLYIFFAGRFVS